MNSEGTMEGGSSLLQDSTAASAAFWRYWWAWAGPLARFVQRAHLIGAVTPAVLGLVAALCGLLSHSLVMWVRILCMWCRMPVLHVPNKTATILPNNTNR